MTDIEGPVEEPYVGFDADAAVREGSVEGKSAPVVIVGVYCFLSSSVPVLEMELMKREANGRFTGTTSRVKSVG